MKTSQPMLRLPNPDDWLDQAGAVKATGLSRSTIHEMAAEDPPRLRAYRIGAHRVYWKDDVDALAAALKLVRGTTQAGK